MPQCPADCADVSQIPNISNCDLPTRNDNIDRMFFYNCDQTLPDPLTCAALQALADAGQLSFSSPLSNVDLQDPEYVELSVSDCLPATEIASGRVVAF